MLLVSLVNGNILIWIMNGEDDKTLELSRISVFEVRAGLWASVNAALRRDAQVQWRAVVGGLGRGHQFQHLTSVRCWNHMGKSTGE
jgi:hypothetical protein